MKDLLLNNDNIKNVEEGFVCYYYDPSIKGERYATNISYHLANFRLNGKVPTSKELLKSEHGNLFRAKKITYDSGLFLFKTQLRHDDNLSKLKYESINIFNKEAAELDMTCKTSIKLKDGSIVKISPPSRFDIGLTDQRILINQDNWKISYNLNDNDFELYYNTSTRENNGKFTNSQLRILDDGKKEKNSQSMLEIYLELNSPSKESKAMYIVCEDRNQIQFIFNKNDYGLDYVNRREHGKDKDAFKITYAPNLLELDPVLQKLDIYQTVKKIMKSEEKVNFIDNLVYQYFK